MSFSNWVSVAALALLPLAATAQQPEQQQPDPSDGSASVPASTYVSAFKNYQAAASAEATPDKLWRAANEDVQTDTGHAGHAKASAQEVQRQPQADVPKAAPHAGHSGHNMGAK
ncbi:MAG: hypothetical protein JWR22_1439 [Herminiimonas sp.]|nr:hypothetical protein [Herminiimonas sp.]